MGQCRLIALWDKLFEQLEQPVGQILLTRNDIADVSLDSEVDEGRVWLINWGRKIDTPMLGILSGSC